MMAPFIYDPEVAMPEFVQRAHHDLCESARDCYDMRDAALDNDPDLAREFDESGDVFLYRACALLEEWDA
jgi:hypothetical protein